MTGIENSPAFMKSLVDRLVELRVGVDAELLDRDPGVSGARRSDRLFDRCVERLRLQLVGRAQLERDERRVAVARDLTVAAGLERRAYLLHRGECSNRPGDVGDRRSERGVVDRPGLALDQDRVALRLLEVVGQDRLDLAGLAGARLLRIELLRADRVADRERGQHEREPGEDRRLACVALQRPIRPARLRGVRFGLRRPLGSSWITRVFISSSFVSRADAL